MICHVVSLQVLPTFKLLLREIIVIGLPHVIHIVFANLEIPMKQWVKGALRIQNDLYLL